MKIVYFYAIQFEIWRKVPTFMQIASFYKVIMHSPIGEIIRSVR